MKRIAIIGAGTSCLALLESLNLDTTEVTVYDCGSDPFNRKTDDLLYGFGGAGTFSDGKLSFSPAVGGELPSLIPKLSAKKTFTEYATKAASIWKGIVPPIETPLYTNLAQTFCQHNMSLIDGKFVHLGTEAVQNTIKEMYNTLISRKSITYRQNQKYYYSIKVVGDHILIANSSGKDDDTLRDSDYSEYDYLVIATGRTPPAFFIDYLDRIGGKDLYTDNIIDIGVRYEIPASITNYITDKLYEFKVQYYTLAGEMVRTFCVNPGGYVVKENSNGYSLVNGHSFKAKEKKTENTNFAILVRQQFTSPFKDAVEYGKSLAVLANKLAGGNNCLVQRLSDFRSGRRSTESRILKGLVSPTYAAVPGDLNLVLPRRIANAIEDFIVNLNKAVPGIANDSNLLYGLEIKFYSVKYNLNEHLQIPKLPIFVIGDASGYTRGIMQASISGMMVAEYFNTIV